MKEISVRKKKKIYRTFSFVSTGLTSEKEENSLVFSEGKNCDFSKGKLSTGLGVKGLKNKNGEAVLAEFDGESLASVCLFFENGEWQTGACAAILMKNGRLLFYDAEEEDFVQRKYGVANDSLLLPVYKKRTPAAVAILGKDGVSVVYPDGQEGIIYTSPVSPIGAFFHGRIFFVERFSLCYGAPFEFDDYEQTADDAGKIELGAEGGEILAIVRLGEKLFVVRQHALAEISASGAAREFVVKTIPFGASEIQRGSVCAVGEAIVFLAVDGVYRFLNGNFERLVSGRIAERDELKGLVASYSGNTYRLGYTTLGGEEKVLAVNVEDGSYYPSFVIHGVSSGGMAVGVKDLRLVLSADRGGMPLNEECFVRATNVDFGERGEKVVRRIDCVGQGEIELTVRGERGEKSAVLALHEKNAMKFALKGREFCIEIRCKEGASVESLEVEYDLIGGGK